MNSLDHNQAALVPREQIREAAARWSDALRESGSNAELRREFEHWYDENPAHAEAFESIDRSYRIARAASRSNVMLAMHSQALARVATRNRRGRRRFMALAASVAAVAAVTLALLMASGGSWQEMQYLAERTRYAMNGDTFYRTAIGQRLAVALKDGSTMTLNTNSRAVVEYHDSKRGISLLSGQALFEVAKDPDHPFVVTAAGRKVTALGTAFDVRISGERVAVTLIEGHVSIEPDAEIRKAVHVNQPVPVVRSQLSPGEQLVAMTPQAAPVIHKADVERVVSWRDGQLIFQNDRLTDALQEFNRYGTRHIVLADPQLGDLRISGAFNTGNASGFVATLTSYFDVRVVDADSERIVLGPGGHP